MNSRKAALIVKSPFIASLALGVTLLAGCAGGGLTTREKGAGIGALGGAAMGGLIGSAVHHPAAGLWTWGRSSGRRSATRQGKCSV
jgi:hypothetical protein